MTALHPPVAREGAPPSRTPRRRGILLFSLTLVVAALVAALILVAVPLVRSAVAVPYVPTAQDGELATPAAVDDTALPAIARLDPQLRSALDQAADAAAADGVVVQVTSGWRSRDYQQWLFDRAVHEYRSTAIARQWVDTPDSSSHVTGHAVDVGGIDAQLWLIQHGSAWGLCQIYANERWHFERATTPGGACPALRTDAAG